ncbi:MAG: YecH family protein [Opitutaceae bacterium]|nr:YecH family protein [Opitutaceae bacterium]
MSSLIHGHEVIDMLRESEAFYTRDSLAAAIIARFGVDTRFQTCSDHGMTAIQLVEFLANRGKIIRTAGGFVVDPERVCHRDSSEPAGAATGSNGSGRH